MSDCDAGQCQPQTADLTLRRCIHWDLNPIVDLESGDSSEFTFIVGNDYRRQISRMRCNEQVVCTDHRAFALRMGTNVSVVIGRLGGKVEQR